MGAPPVLPFNLKLHVKHLFEQNLEIIDSLPCETPSYFMVMYFPLTYMQWRALAFRGNSSRKLHSRVLIADIYIHNPKEQHTCSETYKELFIENKTED